jgi:hypothetical protein
MSRKFAYDIRFVPPTHARTSREGSAAEMSSRSMDLTTLYSVVFTPTPRPNDRTAINGREGLFDRLRADWLSSLRTDMVPVRFAIISPKVGGV